MKVWQTTRSLALTTSIVILSACGGGGGGGSSGSNSVNVTANASVRSCGNTQAGQGPSNFASNCNGSCASASPANLTVADVQQVIAQAVQEAVARNVNATIAVSDRVGNILGLFQMTGAPATFTIRSGLVDSFQGLENINVLPSDQAAIAKAVTGAYLASEGNAFSTRTASHIVQEHFDPLEFGQPGGPLFGVQFSQLPCGDLVQQGAGIGIGPRRSPLGFSADPGGLPLYKNGHPVGGIGVISDSTYSLDRNIDDEDRTILATPEFGAQDEIIALAGGFGFLPPNDRLACRITVDGRTLRFADANDLNILTVPSATNFTEALNSGALIDDNAALAANVQNYFVAGNGILAGTTFGQANSGIESADVTNPGLYAGLDAFVLSDGAGTNRFPPINGVDLGANGDELIASEVTQIMRSALDVANRARAQIRRPLNSQARVTISIVDTDGNILAIARTRDAPIFGTDVSLQKARTATFFSSTDAGAVLIGTGNADRVAAGGGPGGALPYTSSIAQYTADVRSFFVDNNALANGVAFSDRAGGNLSRPYFPDGVLDGPNGPLSKPFTAVGNFAASGSEWSPFNPGLQLDLFYNQIVDHLASGTNTANCTEIGSTRLANGIQIFPGSVPIYRNGILVGGIGVSGDGVDQDDMVSFLGTANASIVLGKANGIGDTAVIGNAPITPFLNNNGVTVRRADSVAVQGSLLRYIQCPQNPFINSNSQNVCDGF